MGNSIRLGQVFGVGIELDYSWFLIFFLVIWSLINHYGGVGVGGVTVFNVALAVVTAVLFFGSLLAHELGHSWVAINAGVPVKRISLFLFGGVAQITKESDTARDELLIAVAGPIVSLVLSIIFGLLWLSAKRFQIAGLIEMGLWLAGINLSLAVFNLIPGYPLDGGRVLRALVWKFTDNRQRATKMVAMIGQSVSLTFVFFGALLVLNSRWINGSWLILIGWYLNKVATSELKRNQAQNLLAGRKVNELMNINPRRMSLSVTLGQLVDEYILGNGERYFIVMESNQMAGLVTVHQIQNISRDQWNNTTLGEIMVPIDELYVVHPKDEIIDVWERMRNGEVDQILVEEKNGQLGVIGRDHIREYIHTISNLVNA